MKDCYTCQGSGRNKFDDKKPCNVCKGSGKLVDYTTDEWSMCKNCTHSLFKIGNIWKHAIPGLATNLCNHKTCICGGDGFQIYGQTLRNEICGICNLGKICNCTMPEPAPFITIK